MLKLCFEPPARRLCLLCIGAHSDDLEIGCSGTVLEWLAKYPQVDVTWVVLSARGERKTEARDSAEELLRSAQRRNLILGDLRDGYFPAQYEQAKNFFEELKAIDKPDIVLTHRLDDRHQDHQLVAELTWQTFRDHLIFEYEIPKYEGDLGRPHLYVPLSVSVAQRKVEHLERHFQSQRARDWFRSETFLGLMQLRGIESRSPSGLAEAFYPRKLCL